MYGSAAPELQDEAGMLAAVRRLDERVQAEVAQGIPEERILVGGFSQGISFIFTVGGRGGALKHAAQAASCRS